MTVVAVVLTMIRRTGACEHFAELFVGVPGLSWDPTGMPSHWHDKLGQSGHSTAPSERAAGGVCFFLCWDFIIIVIALLMQKEGLTQVDRCFAVDNYLLILRELDSF